MHAMTLGDIASLCKREYEENFPQILRHALYVEKFTAHEALRRNLEKLKTYYGLSERQLARKARVDQKTINRFRNGEHSMSLESLQSIAESFGLSAWQLLCDEFTVEHPPAIYEPTHREKELWDKLRQAAKEIIAADEAARYRDDKTLDKR